MLVLMPHTVYLSKALWRSNLYLARSDQILFLQKIYVTSIQTTSTFHSHRTRAECANVTRTHTRREHRSTASLNLNVVRTQIMIIKILSIHVNCKHYAFAHDMTYTCFNVLLLYFELWLDLLLVGNELYFCSRIRFKIGT